MNKLKTDYLDAELAPTMDNKRRYMQSFYEDGTFSMLDRTAYVQKGDNFGASDINATNQAVNELADSLSHINELILDENWTTDTQVMTFSASVKDYTYLMFSGTNENGSYLHFSNPIVINNGKDRDKIYVIVSNAANVGTIIVTLDKTANTLTLDSRVFGAWSKVALPIRIQAYGVK